MPNYEFQVLCYDGGATCQNVMNGMKEDFTNVKKSKVLNADHSGVRICENIMDAEKIFNELMKKYKGSIKRVTIVPK